MTRSATISVLLIAIAAVCGVAVGQYAPGGMKISGVTPGGAINQGQFTAGSPASGFTLNSLTPSLSVDPASTAQAKFSSNGDMISGTVIQTHLTIITACPAGAGVTLPAVTQSMEIVIMNRSGVSCNIWPTIGATVQQASGADGAVNAPFAMPSTGDYGFRAQSATRWLW